MTDDMPEGRNGRRLNKFEREYIAEIDKALKERTDLTDGERHLLEMEVCYIRDGTLSLAGPETVEERIERHRDHYP